MTTTRSRNKLERKAHMNIHDTLEVTEDQQEGQSFTRDRFGKRQSVKLNDENN